MQGPFLRKYGVQTIIDFTLYKLDGTGLKSDAVHAEGDSVIMKDEGPEASTTNAFIDEGQTYSIILTATEMQAARIVLSIVDLSGPQVWLDTTIYIETYGNASAQHAVDLSDGIRMGLSALPNAIPDSASGLPIKSSLATSSEMVTDLLASYYAGTLTIQSLFVRLRAALVGKSTGHPAHPVFYEHDDVTPAMEADVDADGNRSGVDSHGG